MDEEALPEPVRALLGLSTMTLATCGSNGEPHAAPVYFVADQTTNLRLYFFSAADSQHSQDLYHNPAAAAAIYPEVWDWRSICGLQLRGRVDVIPSGEEWHQAWQAYQDKFPFVRHLRMVVARTLLYRFQPNWLRWIDNRYGLGYKREWDFP